MSKQVYELAIYYLLTLRKVNRKIISQVAKWHFTPTKTATENLLREGVDKASIHEVGNTVIDALKYVSEQLEDNSDFTNNFRDKYGCDPKTKRQS